jgi:prolipoprotein diacylglyceryltransferase
MYGLTLLAAIALCVWVTGRRWVSRGGDWDLIFRCAVWGVAAGIVGARLYQIATSWN